MKKNWIYIAVILVLLLVVVVLLFSVNNDIDILEGDDEVLFSVDMGWGPCPVDEGCYRIGIIYNSGKVEINAWEEELGAVTETYFFTNDQIATLKNKIRETDVLNKNCVTDAEILDFWATYKINLDGKSKEVRSPGCQEEMFEIAELIDDMEGEIEESN